MMHLKVVRAYIDGVLRYGIPPKFFIGVVIPKKGCEKSVLSDMSAAIADKEMAECICCENPARVAAGDPIQSQSRSRSARATRAPKRSWFGMRAL